MLKRFSILLFLLILNKKIFNQIYPVSTFTQVTPPYPASLDRYVSGEVNKINLRIVVNDATIVNYPVRLRMVLKYNNIIIRTADRYKPMPIYLNGGEVITLSSADLIEYFKVDNLDFIGYSKGEYVRLGQLPEGVYQLYFEVVDYYRGYVISSNNSAILYISINEPPILNTPIKGAEVSVTGQQNIIFSWTQRHSLNAYPGFVPQYLFELWEITPDDVSPYVIVKSTKPIYREITRSTTLQYNDNYPQLLAGKRYVWRVKVIDEEGILTFKNEGYSDISWFKYGRDCKSPVLRVESVGADRVKLSWTTEQLHSGYELRYRSSRQSEDTWYSYKTEYLSATIDRLKSSTEYIFQIKGMCGNVESEYSEEVRVRTKIPMEFECGGKAEKVEITNNERLMNLMKGDYIKAGDFDVEVLYAEGNNGVFRGKALIRVPMFGFIKLEADLEDVVVNTDYQLIGGRIRSVYNVGNSLTMNVTDLYKSIFEEERMVEEENPFLELADRQVEVGDSIKEIRVINNQVYIDTEGGVTKVITIKEGEMIAITGGGKEVVIDGSSGMVYVQGTKDGKAPKKGKDLKEAGEGEKRYVVTFDKSENQMYGFDKAVDDKLSGNYKKAKMVDNGKYVSWKSMEVGGIDRVKAIIEGDSVDLVNFSRQSNLMVMVGEGGKKNEKEILITGQGEGDEDILYGWYTYNNEIEDTTKKEKELYYAGELNIVTYEKEINEVCLVGVNGSVVPEAGYIERELNRIYRQAVVGWRVTVLEGGLKVDLKNGYEPKLDNTDLNNRMDYTEDMDKVIKELKKSEAYNRKVYYLFFINEGTDKRINGYMPLKGRYGFIFKNNQGVYELMRTIAHELGHGAYRLRHTFSGENRYREEQGKTNNLMDYVPADRAREAEELKKYQWDYIHDPDVMLFARMEEEEEGVSVMTDISTINTWKEIFPKMTDSELIRISRIYDTVAVQFDSLNINSITNNIYFKGDLKDWSVRKSSHTGKLKQVVINIATKDKADYNGIDSKEIYLEKYTYEIKIDTIKRAHTTNVALHSYVNALNFTKPKITSFEKLREITTIKIATFKLKSNKREDPTLPLPLDSKFKLPLYRIDDYVIIAFYSSIGNNPDIVFQLIPEEESTKNMEVAFWLKHLDILNDTANAIVLNTVQLLQIFPNADTARIREVVTAINKYSSEFNINTIERMSHFLGQIGTETTDVSNGKPLSALVESCNYNEERIKEVFGKRVKEEEITIKDKTYKPLLNPELFDGFDSSLNYYFEISDKKVKTDTIYCLQADGTFRKYPYSGQRIKKEYLNGANNCALFNYVYCCNKSGLGNGDVSTGDGSLFRGRGFIHLTGRSNYETKFYKYWKMEYPDDKRKLEELVTLLETDVDLAIKVSMIYWKYNGINQYIKSTYIDVNNDEIRQVSILVNGGNVYKKSKDKIEGYSNREKNTINAYRVLIKK